jgi:hypothetical protein
MLPREIGAIGPFRPYVCQTHGETLVRTKCTDRWRLAKSGGLMLCHMLRTQACYARQEARETGLYPVSSWRMLTTFVSPGLTAVRHASHRALQNVLPVYNLPALLDMVVKALVRKLPPPMKRSIIVIWSASDTMRPPVIRSCA